MQELSNKCCQSAFTKSQLLQNAAARREGNRWIPQNFLRGTWRGGLSPNLGEDPPEAPQSGGPPFCPQQLSEFKTPQTLQDKQLIILQCPRHQYPSHGSHLWEVCRGKVMSQGANKLQEPFLANSIYSRSLISKMSINSCENRINSCRR